MHNAKQLTARIKQIVQKMNSHDGSTAQVLLTTYFNGRMVEEIAASPYRNNFILKGGYLLENMTSVEQRTTADVDLTIQGIKDDKASLALVIERVFEKPTIDGITFTDFRLQTIRQAGVYPGIRVLGRATFDGIWTKVKLDITTGDAIYGGTINFTHRNIVDGYKIKIRAYSAEQIVAEKLQTIVERGLQNTRGKDFYDIALLTSDAAIAQIDYQKIYNAFNAVSKRKGTITESSSISKTVYLLSQSDYMKDQWQRFSENEGHTYVNKMSYEQAITSVSSVLKKSKIIE